MHTLFSKPDPSCSTQVRNLEFSWASALVWCTSIQNLLLNCAGESGSWWEELHIAYDNNKEEIPLQECHWPLSSLPGHLNWLWASFCPNTAGCRIHLFIYFYFIIFYFFRTHLFKSYCRRNRLARSSLVTSTTVPHHQSHHLCSEFLPHMGLNRLWTGQGHCAASLHRWGQCEKPNCSCGQTQTRTHMVDNIPV